MMGLVVQARLPSWLRTEDHKFKVTLDNMARYCFKDREIEACWQSTCLACSGEGYVPSPALRHEGGGLSRSSGMQSMQSQGGKGREPHHGCLSQSESSH